tara:strand:- start:167 stop:496 length:330 start_codon:yes stop_codon:yes gene_type:complete
MALTGQAKSDYNKAYRKAKRERIRKLQRDWYLQNEGAEKAKREKRNRKKFNPRGGDGARAKRKVKVPAVRRWTIIADEATGEDFAFFNKETGYPLAELQGICDLLRRIK